ncbi:hypothetical protein ACFWCB_25880 [Streptomyces sp. NPDC060048]|uniref:hypothetical protein n=1 Tax=unclassified Streptomyces TaxID=2593676 RepID=UPI0036A5899C
MRTALRTSIVTAALAGALLAPAATALAAPAASSVPAVTSVPVAANTSDDDRYDGESVLVGKGRIAVLRNKSEGPEAWIRAVAADWKPGDGWAGRVLAKLDPSHPRAVVEGTQYDLTKTNDGRYGLNVRVLGEGASDGFYLLPKAEPATKPSTKPSVKPSAAPSVKPTAKPSAPSAPSAKAAVAPTTDVKPQTAVVPKGPVAAGAELAAADTDDSTTAAAGAGLVAIFAGLGTAFMVRARKTRARG